MIANHQIAQAVEQLKRRFVGKDGFLEKVMITLLSGGHLLLEDKPGVGKTTLANSLAKILQCDFGRIQFTPDTMPGDVMGVSVYSQQTGTFSYVPGPVMHQVLLADEINRTSPKTQASLLEAMEEGQVTVDGVIHPLPKPFFVIATQNPMEFSGTYPLPEAQLDRFFMRLSIGYPSRDQAKLLAKRWLHTDGSEVEEASQGVLTVQELCSLQEQVKGVTVSGELVEYLVQLVEMTREPEQFSLGASPRAMLALLRASQARAFLQGRTYCIPDDIKQMAEPVLSHRLIPAAAQKAKRVRAEALLQEGMRRVPVPVGR